MIYLSGPMTGIPEFNYPMFNAVAKALRLLGYEVDNPAEHFNGDVTFEKKVYMRKDFDSLLKVDAIVTMTGWEESSGARAEVLVGQELGLPIYLFHNGWPLQIYPKIKTVVEYGLEH